MSLWKQHIEPRRIVNPKVLELETAKEILADWAAAVQRFVRVIPHEYRRVLDHQKEMEDRARALARIQTAA